MKKLLCGFYVKVNGISLQEVMIPLNNVNECIVLSRMRLLSGDLTQLTYIPQNKHYSLINCTQQTMQSGKLTEKHIAHNEGLTFLWTTSPCLYMANHHCAVHRNGH